MSYICIESQRPANKRRKRKGSSGTGGPSIPGGGPTGGPAASKKRSPGPNNSGVGGMGPNGAGFNLASQVCYFSSK